MIRPILPIGTVFALLGSVSLLLLRAKYTPIGTFDYGGKILKNRKNTLTITLLLLLATLILFGGGITDAFANFDTADSDDPEDKDNSKSPPKRSGPKLPNWGTVIFQVFVVLVVCPV